MASTKANKIVRHARSISNSKNAFHLLPIDIDRLNAPLENEYNKEHQFQYTPPPLADNTNATESQNQSGDNLQIPIPPIQNDTQTVSSSTPSPVPTETLEHTRHQQASAEHIPICRSGTSFENHPRTTEAYSGIASQWPATCRSYRTEEHHQRRHSVHSQGNHIIHSTASGRAA